MWKPLSQASQKQKIVLRNEGLKDKQSQYNISLPGHNYDTHSFSSFFAHGAGLTFNYTAMLQLSLSESALVNTSGMMDDLMRQVK